MSSRDEVMKHNYINRFPFRSTFKFGECFLLGIAIDSMPLEMQAVVKTLLVGPS